MLTLMMHTSKVGGFQSNIGHEIWNGTAFETAETAFRFLHLRTKSIKRDHCRCCYVCLGGKLRIHDQRHLVTVEYSRSIKPTNSVQDYTKSYLL